MAGLAAALLPALKKRHLAPLRIPQYAKALADQECGVEELNRLSPEVLRTQFGFAEGDTCIVRMESFRQADHNWGHDSGHFQPCVSVITQSSIDRRPPHAAEEAEVERLTRQIIDLERERKKEADGPQLVEIENYKRAKLPRCGRSILGGSKGNTVTAMFDHHCIVDQYRFEQPSIRRSVSTSGAFDWNIHTGPSASVSRDKLRVVVVDSVEAWLVENVLTKEFFDLDTKYLPKIN